jgi:hypothetical protein
MRTQLENLQKIFDSDMLMKMTQFYRKQGAKVTPSEIVEEGEWEEEKDKIMRQIFEEEDKKKRRE